MEGCPTYQCIDHHGSSHEISCVGRGCLPGDLDLFPSAYNHAAVPLRASADQTVTATCPGILREVKPTPRGMATAHKRNREPTHSPHTNWHVFEQDNTSRLPRHHQSSKWVKPEPTPCQKRPANERQRTKKIYESISSLFPVKAHS